MHVGGAPCHVAQRRGLEGVTQLHRIQGADLARPMSPQRSPCRVSWNHPSVKLGPWWHSAASGLAAEQVEAPLGRRADRSFLPLSPAVERRRAWQPLAPLESRQAAFATASWVTALAREGGSPQRRPGRSRGIAARRRSSNSGSVLFMLSGLVMTAKATLSKSRKRRRPQP